MMVGSFTHTGTNQQKKRYNFEHSEVELPTKEGSINLN